MVFMTSGPEFKQFRRPYQVKDANYFKLTLVHTSNNV